MNLAAETDFSGICQSELGRFRQHDFLVAVMAATLFEKPP
jgi:hypothetical protein